MDKEQIEELKFKWPLSTHSMCEGCSAPDDVGKLIAEIERLEKEIEELKKPPRLCMDKVIAMVNEDKQLRDTNFKLTAIAEKARAYVSATEKEEYTAEEDIKADKAYSVLQQALAAWEGVKD